MPTEHAQPEPFACSFPFRAGHHYLVDPNTGCWNWQLFKFRGYGKCGDGYAHRVAYAAVNGLIPRHLDAHHACGNPACINPEHLELVTRSAHLQHHKQGSSNLTAADVVRIRERAATGERFSVIVRDYDVSEDAIFLIVKGETWTNVGGPIGKPPRACLWCGGPIGPERNHGTRYCSSGHRTNYHSRRARERKRALEATRK